MLFIKRQESSYFNNIPWMGVVVLHTLNPCLCEFEASLIYTETLSQGTNKQKKMNKQKSFTKLRKKKEELTKLKATLMKEIAKIIRGQPDSLVGKGSHCPA